MNYFLKGNEADLKTALEQAHQDKFASLQGSLGAIGVSDARASASGGSTALVTADASASASAGGRLSGSASGSASSGGFSMSGESGMHGSLDWQKFQQAQSQIQFLNSIIVDMQQKNEVLRTKIEALEAGCSSMPLQNL